MINSNNILCSFFCWITACSCLLLSSSLTHVSWGIPAYSSLVNLLQISWSSFHLRGRDSSQGFVEALKNLHNIILPPLCVTLGMFSLDCAPHRSLSKHEPCLCDQGALVLSHQTKELTSSVHTHSLGCPSHTSVWLEGVSYAEVESSLVRPCAGF